MKKILLPLALLSTILAATAQISDSTPYSLPSYNTEYNMFESIEFKGTSLVLGPLG